jgi:CRISPR-associated protein Cmr2
MVNKYIGLTIGPIFDTVNLTSSPAALWAASYMFSSLSKCICELLTEKYGVKPEQIVTPYYDKNAELLNKNDGIGLFHDRVIFRSDGFDVSVMDQLRTEAITHVAEMFHILDVEFLKEYIMIAHVEFEGGNPILDGGKLLDAMELSKPYVFASAENPILSLFTNAKGEENKNDSDGELRKTGKNKAVKALLRDFKGFQLEKYKKDGDVILKSLTDITRTGVGYKRFKYYAIVRSDGDRMGQIIGSLDNDKDIKSYSETCLSFCSEVAAKVGEYGGVTIYSGGDDLLAILPCEKDGATVFDFVQDANKVFHLHFKKYRKPTSLSFGIFIANNHFPFYEALSQSADLLFGVAKAKRNCVAVKLQKHSGQTEALVISNRYLPYFRNLTRLVMKETDQLLLSAMHKVDLFGKVFRAAFDYQTIHNLFVNTFDADVHDDNNFVHVVLPNLFRFLQSHSDTDPQTNGNGEKASDSNASAELTAAQESENSKADANKNAEMIQSEIMTNAEGIFAVDETGICQNDSVKTFQFILRILKFFIEKEGD